MLGHGPRPSGTGQPLLRDVLVDRALVLSQLIPQHSGMELDVSMWHMIDVERALTWCELFLTQGSERRLRSETPEDRRCQTRMGWFGEDVVRSPVTD